MYIEQSLNGVELRNVDSYSITYKFLEENFKGFFEAISAKFDGGDIQFTVTEQEIEGQKVLVFKPKEVIQIVLPF